MHDELHEAIGKMRPVLSTPGRGRDIAVKINCELDCQALSLLHIRYAEAGGVQPRGKVIKLSLVWKKLARSVAVRRMLQRRACLFTCAHLATLLSAADVEHASWNKRWTWLHCSQQLMLDMHLEISPAWLSTSQPVVHSVPVAGQCKVCSCGPRALLASTPSLLVLAAHRMLLLVRQMDDLGGDPGSQVGTPLRWPAPCPCQTLPEVVICAGTSWLL